MFLRNCISNFLIRRQIHSNAEIVENCTEIRNRNLRSMERIRIKRKAIGYTLDKIDVYWHRLNIECSNRIVKAEIHHIENGLVLTASSQEWGIRKQLYNAHDIVAHKFVGQILAQRCLQSGICEVFINEKNISGPKKKALIDEMQKSGIILSEPDKYKHPKPTDNYRPEKPWETYE